MNGVHDDIKGITNFFGKNIGKITDATAKLTGEIPSTITSSVSSISNALPYVAGAAAVGLIGYVMMNKPSSSQNARTIDFRLESPAKRHCFGLKI